jgi:hypothetical protein
MTEAEWHQSSDPEAMLKAAQDAVTTAYPHGQSRGRLASESVSGWRVATCSNRLVLKTRYCGAG